MSSRNSSDLIALLNFPEVFNQPLPQIRQVHRNFLTQLDEKNAQLRTHVGGSYRQLLGTAETILLMSELIQKVEDDIAHVSHACGKNVIDHLGKGLKKLHEDEKRGKRKEELQWLSQVKGIDMLCVILGNLLRKNDVIENNKPIGGPLVTASKIFTLSQSMLKSVEEIALLRNLESQELVHNTKIWLYTLRRELLMIIDRILRNIASDDREDIVQALTSYTLVTGCGLKNVLNYFLLARELAIANYFERNSQTSNKNMVKSLTFYAQTLFDTTKIFPHGLSVNLSHLKGKPLFQDKGIRDIEELRVDELEKWLDDDVLSFTPLLNEEEIDSLYITDHLLEWDRKVSNVLLKRLSETVGYQVDFMTVFNLRTEILGTWMREAANLKSFDSSILLKKLRDVLNIRILDIIAERSGTLRLVGIELRKTAASLHQGITDKQESLWDRSILEMEIKNGAALFQKRIIARTLGHNDAISRSLSCYQKWRQLIDETILIIEQFKKQKWDIIFEELEEGVDIDASINSLSIDDPQMFRQHLEIDLKKDFAELEDLIESLLKESENSENVGQISVYILRIVREIRSSLPKVDNIQDFGVSFFDRLLERIVKSVSKNSLAIYLCAVKKVRCVGRILWEGDPELPVQPSPAAFKLLYNLTKSMGEIGQDLWSSTAVLILKKHLSLELTSKWVEILKEDSMKDSCKMEPENFDDERLKERKREAFIQAFFDFSFLLRNALQNPDAISINLIAQSEEFINSQIKLEPRMQDHISQCARNYWNRTSLLFGTLA